MAWGNGKSKRAVHRSYLLLALVVLTLATGTVWGQATASMKGTVKDTSGALVPDTTVTVKHVETGLTRTTASDATGSYNLAALPVGQYEVEAQKTGFKQMVRRGITLAVGQQAVVDLTLELGTVEQRVTVTAEAPLVNTTVSSTSGLISESQVKDLPLNGRSFDQLLTLNAGTVNFSSNATRNNFSVGGKRPEQNLFLLNGVEYTATDQLGLFSTPYGASGQALGVDAVREFNLLTETYGAEYGKRPGGQVNIVTSSGTNQLRGSVFEFLRNSALDARNFFDRRIGAPPFKRNQFGGSLGGPLKQDKLFLFGNYEGFRQRLGLSTVAPVPDADARRGFLPIGPNNSLIEVPNLQRGMLPFFVLWKLPNGPNLGGGQALTVSNPLQKIREDFGLTRFDYNISEKDAFSANFLFDDGESVTPTTGTNFLNTSILKGAVVNLQETRVFSPTLLNLATLGFTRGYALTNTLPTVPFPVDHLFVSGGQPGGISIGGGLLSGEMAVVRPGGSPDQYIGRNLFTGADNVRYTKGNHSLSVGVWVQRVQDNALIQTQGASGLVLYSTLLTMLQDNPSAFNAPVGMTSQGWRTTLAAWYVQDEIKLKPNLTLRLGLRDEMTSGFNEKSCRAANYEYDQNGVIRTDPFIGCSALTQNNALALWQPRVGVAWDPTGTGTWSVRAGAGIHHDLQDYLTFRLGNYPFNSIISKPRGVPLLSYIPIPTGVQPAPPCNFQLQSTNQPCAIYGPAGVEPTFYTPTVQQWSFSIERQLSSNVMLRVGYLGSEAYHQQVFLDVNIVVPLRCTDPQGCVSGGLTGQVGRVAQGTTYVPIAPRANPYVANTGTWFFEGNGNYNALNVSLVQRTSHGLSFTANYTFSKVIDVASSLSPVNATNVTGYIYNRYDLSLSRGVGAYSLRHQFNGNFTYELPFGSGKPFGSGATGFWEKLIGGWQWNGILTLQSGFPFTPQVGSNISGTGDTRVPDAPNWNPAFSGRRILGTPNQWVDPRQFSLPTPGTFGNSGRGVLIGPGLTALDTSLFKGIPLSERLNLQFRVEAFNIFNHANFGNPSPIIFSGANYNPSAGIITRTATTSRQLQFALKLTF